LQKNSLFENKFEFIIHIDVTEITNKLIENFHNGTYGIICIENASENTVEQFGKLLDQDMYGRKKVTIGLEDEKGEKLSHDTNMLWHQDRAYSKDVHPFVGLYCICADIGSSPTYYLDMQGVYRDSSVELKKNASNTQCINSITKYMTQEQYPYQFKNKVQERAWRMKNRSKHDLVWYDKYGPFYFFSEAYTESDLEPLFKKEIYKEKYMYSHYWKPKQLLVYNNYKILHKRDETPVHVDRRHLRFAFEY